MDFFEFHACDATLFLPGLSLKRLNALFVKLENTGQDLGLQDSVTHIFTKHDAKVTSMCRNKWCDHETNDNVVVRRHKKGFGTLDRSITVDGTTIQGNDVMYPGGP